MGDLANGLAWLCGTCCGLRKADITADGSRFSSSGKAHPAEKEIDKEFMARNYRKDAAGYLHSQPTATSPMVPRQNSDDSKKSKRSVPTQAQEEQQTKDDDVPTVQVMSAPQDDDDDVPIITVDEASVRRHNGRHSWAGSVTDEGSVEGSVDSEQASLKSAG